MPIGNTRAYVLNEYGNLAPIGMAGELYLGGAGVARGYLNRPELTAERFLANPFSSDADARLYKTGDQARWLADGTLEFLGRQDGQVKLRGFRIELGEIEAALAQHPAVARCAVVMRTARNGSKQLLAYWCPLPATTPVSQPPDLVGHLKSRLPGYMIPAHILKLSALPLTTNGKVDRGALPETPEHLDQHAHTSDNFVSPRNELEASLARIWARHLNIAEPSVRGNFFELGGHSLLAISLLASIENELGLRVSIATLFDHPTIERLAATLGGGVRKPARAVVTPLIEGQSPHGGSTLVMLPSVFGELGQMTLLSSLLPRSLRAYGIRVEGDEPYWDGCKTAEDIARGFIDALRDAAVKGPYILVGYSFAGRMAFEMAQQLAEQGEDVAQVVIVDTSLEVGPRSLRDFVIRDLPSIIANLGMKLQYEFLPEPRAFAAGLGRRLRHRTSKLAKWTRAKLPSFSQASTQPSRADLRIGDSALDRLHLPQIYQRRLEASLEAFRNYEPAVYSGDLTVLACRVQATIHRAQPMYGWARWTTGKVRLRHVPGHHHNLFKTPHIDGLAMVLLELLDELQAERKARLEQALAASQPRSGFDEPEPLVLCIG